MDILKLLGRLLGAAASEPVPARRTSPQRKRTQQTKKRTSAPAKPRRTGQSVRSGTVYGEEPIFRTASQLAMSTPQEIRTMRTFSASGLQSVSMESLFYRQGKFMEHFTDDFPDPAPCKRTTPMYYNLRDAELRTYFTWRTRYRQGMLPDTQTPYLMLYCSEIINLIGVPDASAGLSVLNRLYDDYAETHPPLKKALSQWIPDFCAYYQQPLPLHDAGTAALTAVLRHTQKTPAEFLAALDQLSKYKISKSAFYTKNSELTAEIAYRAYAALLTYYAEQKGLSYPAYLLGEQHREQHILFEGGDLLLRLLQLVPVPDIQLVFSTSESG